MGSRVGLRFAVAAAAARKGEEDERGSSCLEG